MRPLVTRISNEFLALGGTKDIAPTRHLRIRLPNIENMQEENRADVLYYKYVHRPFLARWAADAPAQKKVIQANSHNAYNPCNMCDIDGFHDGDTLRLAGYFKPVMQR